MAFKLTPQGCLIYLTICFYLLALTVRVGTPRKQLGAILYAIGFALAAVSFGFRWLLVGHVPLQNLFEVFLTLGMLMFPLSVFCRRALKVGGEALDMLIGAVLLFPAGFIFAADPQKLPPALQSPLFVPHVAAYLIAYVILTKAAGQAMGLLMRGDESNLPGVVSPETASYRLICLGFPLLTIGLVLGAWWGKLAWGDYWNWDPKELWSLATWLIYLIYFHVRNLYGKKYPKANAALALIGFAAILITLLWVNLSRLFAGLHSYS